MKKLLVIPLLTFSVLFAPLFAMQATSQETTQDENNTGQNDSTAPQQQAASQAEAPAASLGKRFVSDVLYVPLRSGPGNQYRIINAAIKSGTALQLLATSDNGEWANVRLPSGREGWMRTQYVMKETPARQFLGNLKATVTTLQGQNKDLREQNEKLKASNKELLSASKSALSDKTATAEELERIKKLSANAIDLEKRYQTLWSEHDILKTEHDALTAENDKLKSDQQLNFLIYGAGLIILGMILNILLPALKPKKRYSEWT